MECHEARETISAYLDHELDAVAARLLESHLDECAACREELAGLQRIDDAVRGLPTIDLGPDFAARMVRLVGETVLTVERERQGKYSLLERLSRIAVDFVDMVSSARPPSTGTLDEFGDFPPLSMGHIYFKLMDLPA